MFSRLGGIDCALLGDVVIESQAEERRRYDRRRQAVYCALPLDADGSAQAQQKRMHS